MGRSTSQLNDKDPGVCGCSCVLNLHHKFDESLVDFKEVLNNLNPTRGVLCHGQLGTYTFCFVNKNVLFWS